MTTTNIQWKGTDVCIDIYCSCGARSHFDGEFFYFFRCPRCATIYEVGTTVTMTPIALADVWSENIVSVHEYDGD